MKYLINDSGTLTIAPTIGMRLMIAQNDVKILTHKRRKGLKLSIIPLILSATFLKYWYLSGNNLVSKDRQNAIENLIVSLTDLISAGKVSVLFSSVCN